MKSLTEDSVAARALTWLARMVCRHRKLVVYSQIILFILSVLFTLRYLQFDMSRDNLVGANKKYHRNFVLFKQEFPQQDDLVVVVESSDTEKNRQFVERLGAKVQLETNLFTHVFFKKDISILGSKALLFAPEPALEELKTTLRGYEPFVRRFGNT